MNIFYIAFSLFILMDSIGNIPLYISFLKGIPPKRQLYIITRELFIALLIIVLFAFVGDALLRFLHLGESTIQVAGGIILFLLALKMIFPDADDVNEHLPHDGEPFLVPLAVPLVAGPSVLSAVMIYTRQEASHYVMVSAILVAWAASFLILLSAPFLQSKMGWRGILALERLMGLLLTLIAIQMFLNGLATFLQLPPPT